jgi:hypothetical protein
VFVGISRKDTYSKSTGEQSDRWQYFAIVSFH